jgi:predicted cobalt transporter CbtA
MPNTCDVADLIADHLDKLKSILARRGATWGFIGNVTDDLARAFAQAIADHVANADEVWRTPYRGSDRLFYIISSNVVVTQLDGTFESAWLANAAQLAHYRTGVQLK